MTDVNVNALADQAPKMAPPTRTDDQILPHIRWNTNFFRAFTASLTIPSIYIQQFWDTVRYDKIAGCYKCQLDEQWFDLTKDNLRDALLITPVDNNNAFSSPPTPDAMINFVNNLDKKNLTQHTQGKKKATLIVIPSVRFTKLIIYYLQSKHKFHPRPNSLLHLPNEEHVLGYLKFSAKRTKREVFGMPILNDLITDDIRGEQYYDAYLEKVAKHQRYIVGKERSDPESPAPKPAKATKKSKPSAPKATPVTKPVAAKASKSTSSQQPKPAPANTQEKKRKLVMETSDKPSPANSKPGLVTKRRKPTRSLSLVDKFVDEEADMQRAVEECLKSVHDVPWGPLPPVVIREPDSGKFQPLPEEVPGIYAGIQDEGQAGPNPSEQDECQAGPNPGDVVVSQTPSSHVVHVGPNLEHMDLEAPDVST
nr:E-beta-farnesene synthase [Tanacetum cinerariifolium]